MTRQEAEQLALELADALAVFDQELEDAGGDPGPGQWPPLTDTLRGAVHKVRELRRQIPDQRLLPRPACGHCGGQGATYRLKDPDLEGEGPDWFETNACRPCLTTGMNLGSATRQQAAGSRQQVSPPGRR